MPLGLLIGPGEAAMLSFILIASAVGGILLLAAIAFWLWMLVDCAMNESDEGNTRLIWVLIIIFVHFIGAVLYFFFQRRRRLRGEAAQGSRPPPAPAA